MTARTLALALLAACCAGAPAQRARPCGPLRVLAANSRYFIDGCGKAIYLTGSHTWNNLVDRGETDPPEPFDYDRYLRFLTAHHHNFFRLWRWESARWTDRKGVVRYAAPQPWKRTGTKFDLTTVNQTYFDRLRARIVAAGERGIYVSIMLFDCWETRFVPFDGHRCHAANNLQGLNGAHSLEDQEVRRIEEQYVREVVDTVNDLDNVLYEIANECAPASAPWQYHMIRFVKAYEARKPKQHPVGMTSTGAGDPDDTALLFDSPADWISPGPQRDDYRANPPAATGAKVVLSDTDHLWGIGGDPIWVWKSFLRGLNPIWMDPYTTSFQRLPADAEDVRQAMGLTRRYAEKMDLAAMLPDTAISSTAYALANKGREYLVLQPGEGRISIDLSGAPGPFAAEWVNVSRRAVISAGTFPGGGVLALNAPFEGPAVLYLKAAPAIGPRP